MACPGGRQHAAGAAGRVEDADDPAFAEDRVHVRGDQQVDHQVDDLTRREVVTGLAVRVLVELADQVLEDVPHVVGGQFVQVVHCREPADDPVQEPCPGEPGDLAVQAEAVDDPPDVRREAVDVVAQVLRHRGRVRRDRGEVQAGRVAEGKLGRTLLALDAQHRVEPAQHGERQDHVTVLGAPVVTAKQVHHRPDVRRHSLVGWSRSHDRDLSAAMAGRERDEYWRGAGIEIYYVAHQGFSADPPL